MKKTVLGTKIASGGGEDDGERVLTLLGTHEQTAKFICGKLTRYFIGENQPEMEASSAKVFVYTGGDTAKVVRHLLLSEALLTSAPILKRPFDFMVSALRVTEAETEARQPLQEHLRKMGQPVNEWPMPDGYPDGTAEWTGSLLARWNFALQLASGGIGRTQGNWDKNVLLYQLGLPDSDQVLAGLKTALQPHEQNPAQMGALLLASPAFQWR